MSFNARVFRVLIASPSDVSEEREIAVSTIQAWNDLNSAERQLVLLPLRWETHSAPEYGTRPQEVINRQVVDHCDLLVGIFWTRIGSPTGAADSGTLEEIERVAKLEKPVMLYFSQAKQDPDHIELDQLQKLRDFKRKTFPKALVETYSTQIEFRDKLSKQLEIQLRTLLTEQNQTEQVDPRPPSTEIQFEFAEVPTGNRAGKKLAVDSKLFALSEIDELPDYKSATEKASEVTDIGLRLGSGTNKNYYRDMVSYLQRREYFRPIRFWLSNSGSLGARDVYVDIRVTADVPIIVDSVDRAQLYPPRESMSALYGGSISRELPVIEQLGNQWTTHFELPALQPKRDVSPVASIVIGATKSGTITITSRIYADTLPEPVTHTLEIDWTMETELFTARELLTKSGVRIPPPQRVAKKKADD